MDEDLRKAWTQVVTSEDLDRHLGDIGQAQINAGLFLSLLAEARPRDDAEVLLVGVGTGQFLDYLDPDAMAPFRLTCTDINASFLRALEARLARAPRIRARTVLDDIEATALRGPFDVAAAVLLLEHIEWRRGIASLVALGVDWLLLVLQRNDGGPAMVAADRELAPSIRQFATMATPKLVAEEDVTAALAVAGYALHTRREVTAPDRKTMLGLAFRRSATSSG